jgi:hypothetical protein
LEVGDIHWDIPLERNLETRRGLLVAILTHIIKGKERSERIMKSSRKPNHPLSMEKLRKGKKHKLGFLF